MVLSRSTVIFVESLIQSYMDILVNLVNYEELGHSVLRSHSKKVNPMYGIQGYAKFKFKNDMTGLQKRAKQ